MLSAYIPIAIFVAVATGFALFTLVFSSLIHSEKYNQVKLEPYECGIEPLTDARDRYSIRYYLVAMLFVIFDVETVFMFPWAVIFDKLLLFGLIAMIVPVARLLDVARHLRDEPDAAFDMCSDVTATDWPLRPERFDVVICLYSTRHRHRIRVKAKAGQHEPVPSMTAVWPAANWLER